MDAQDSWMDILYKERESKREGGEDTVTNSLIGFAVQRIVSGNYVLIALPPELGL